MLKNRKRHQLSINALHPLLGMGLLLYAGGINADTLPYYPAWWPLGNGTAGNCSFSYPTLQPLSQPRTLIVDNHLPNGAVLYSWSYANFAPNFSGGCSYSNTQNSSFSSNLTLRLFFDSLSSTTPSYFVTNIQGIGLKFYFTYHSKGSSPYSGNVTTMLDGVGIPTEPALGAEYELSKSPSGYLGPIFNTVTTPYPSITRYFDWNANHFSMSLRGELIKIGTVSYTTTPLNINGGRLRLLPMGSGISSGSVDLTQPILGGGGIKIVSPSCRLTSPSDYEIDLGRWVHAGPGTHQPGISLPAYGAIKPINLKLECSGQLDNVQFSFQDTGTSPLGNNNVSVYDNLGGTKIDGLEIEMSYGGIPFKVNKLSDAATSFIKTNTGVQGAVKTNPSDLSFNSQTTIQFGARFVQRTAITRSGSSYTGPVTGRVNMFVTYN